ncbi:hypothetical protein M422DRAFT_256449 [Sphaerobolus stellatus SS14]|uniref:MCM OB domain-containing protein n=1 Tax=Sphaerobolus stellatus (strain SS14) TaxID=990650 RepID=A0A0C9UCC5_SPHS4|nr:hypothetical protein M422DRAFT_256449 [Sphaerobolus stellatus SS14]
MNRCNHQHTKNQRWGDIPIVKDMTHPVADTLRYTIAVELTDDEDPELVYIEQIHTMKTDKVLAHVITDQYYCFLLYLWRTLLNPATAVAGLQTHEFVLTFFHLPLMCGIHELKAERIGMLFSISGTVTRTSEVHPELIFGSFVCVECSASVNDIGSSRPC